MNQTLAAVCAAAVVLWPRLGGAAEGELTLDAALARARDRAPSILAAQAAIDEARGRLVGAAVILRDNPEIDAGAGARFLDGATLLEGNLGVRQVFELGGRRQARIAGATAAVTRASATAADVTRRLLHDAAAAFVAALEATERQRLAEVTAALATETVHMAERRYRAGDVGVLDLNVATVALARAQSEVQARAAAADASRGVLRVVLGMGAAEPLSVSGDLRDRRRFALTELLARAPQRPDLQALAAEAQEARADARLGRALRWPNVGVGATYERDDGNNVALGTLSATLPVFERGQGVRAEAEARERRAKLTLEASRRTIGVEVETAFNAYRHREDAVSELETEALPRIDANEALARHSYEVGQLSLSELLIIRRECLETKSEYLTRLLEAAIAGIDLETAAGVLE